MATKETGGGIFQPINQTHAIQEVAFFVIFHRSFEAKDFERAPSLEERLKNSFPEMDRIGFVQFEFDGKQVKQQVGDIGGLEFKKKILTTML